MTIDIPTWIVATFFMVTIANQIAGLAYKLKWWNGRDENGDPK